MSSYQPWDRIDDLTETHSDGIRYVRMEFDLDVPITAADLNWLAEGEVSVEDNYRVDEPRSLWPEGPARTWIGALNHRIAQDEVLASLRREAFFHAEQAENRLAEWEDEQEDSYSDRLKRSEKIAERPVRFSWLDGPA